MEPDPDPHQDPDPKDAVVLIKVDFRRLGGEQFYLAKCSPMEGPSKFALERLFVLSVPPHDTEWVLQQITTLPHSSVLLALQHMCRLLTKQPDRQFIHSALLIMPRDRLADGAVFPKPPESLFTADDIMCSSEQFDAATRDLINHHCFPNGITLPRRSHKEIRKHV